MSAEKTRDLYARWEPEHTLRLVELILTEEPLRVKMQSLVDKHHTHKQESTAHLRYGLMKDYAIKIGMGRGDSRALSIKMINIAKSYGRKKELPTLFTRGWQVAKKMREDAPSRGHSKASNGLALELELKDIASKITDRVSKFSRSPTEPRSNKISKARAKSHKKAKPKRASPTASPGVSSPLVGRRPEPIETRSQEPALPHQSEMEVEDDRLSREGELAMVRSVAPCFQNSDPSLCFITRRTFHRLLESFRPRSGTQAPNQLRLYEAVRQIIALHFEFWRHESRIELWEKRLMADRMLKETIMRMIEDDRNKKEC